MKKLSREKAPVLTPLKSHKITLKAPPINLTQEVAIIRTDLVTLPIVAPPSFSGLAIFPYKPGLVTPPVSTQVMSHISTKGLEATIASPPFNPEIQISPTSFVINKDTQPKTAHHHGLPMDLYGQPYSCSTISKPKLAGRL